MSEESLGLGLRFLVGPVSCGINSKKESEIDANYGNDKQMDDSLSRTNGYKNSKHCELQLREIHPVSKK